MTKLTPILAAALPLLATSCNSSEGEWISLLHNNDLSNWTFDVWDNSPPESIYSIADGVLSIHGTGKPNAVIRTSNSYSNFELEYEWRWSNEAGNSGCLIYCTSPRERHVWPKSLEIQMGHSNAGDFIFIGETIEVTEAQVAETDPNNPNDWKVRLRKNLTDHSEKPVGEWNHARILSDDGVVTGYLNGELVNKGWNATGRTGAISFQAERADLQYRRIRIRSR